MSKDTMSFLPLYKVCDIIGRIGFRGYTRNDIVEPQAGAISLSPANIIKNQLNLENCTYISWDKYEESPEIMILKNDVIFCKTGSVGKTALIKKVDWKMTINPQLTIFRTRKILSSFLHYVVSSNSFQKEVDSIKGTGSVSTISQKDLGNILIPVPDNNIQEEIVETLDSFTNLIDALNEELSLRQKQFEYYREKLLTFDNEEPVKMNDIIINLRTGLNPRTHFKLNTEDADCFYITVRELGLFDIVVDDKTDKINSQAIGRINERSNIQQNDILFSGTGTIGRTALVKNEIYKWNVKEGVYVITPNIMKVNPRYFIYLLHSNYLQIQYEIKAEGGAVKSVSMKEFKSLLVHIPTLAIQQSIVEKLDAFESLISSLKEEIALRQKQYEYYREKLLTFD